MTAGPAVVAGVGNGDPSCLEPHKAPFRTAFHGLARVIVRASVDASGSPEDRALRASVNVDAGGSPLSSSFVQGAAGGAPTSFSVSASAPGLAPASITVPLSVDPRDRTTTFEAAARRAAMSSSARQRCSKSETELATPRNGPPGPRRRARVVEGSLSPVRPSRAGLSPYPHGRVRHAD